MEFYQSLFTTSSPNIPIDLENLIAPMITGEDNAMLTCIPDENEILATLKKMHPEKAPGPDGMTAMFFLSFWNVVGRDVVRTVQDFFREGRVAA